jgi:CubicO group peptidase (beta-lactamase class C family)
MEGTPPTGERLVTLANWQDPPYNRWSFQHVRDLIPTARIPRGPGPVWRLAREERHLSEMKVRTRDHGRTWPLERFLDETCTDGFLVMHRGKIVAERYLNGLAPDATHLLMSVSKSITSAIAGVLIAKGNLAPHAQVTQILPELSGSSFEGCSVRHLLDMRAGTRFNEDYDDVDADVRVYEQIYLWRPRTSPGLPEDVCSYYRTLPNDGAHGGPFRYRSILTDVLSWVLERAAGMRLPELIARDLWRPLGAESDAEITVDAHGNAMADAGVCCTLRDLARFGQLMLQGGRRGGREVVPRAWIQDTLVPDSDQVDAFAGSVDSGEFPPGAYYRNQWWVIDAKGPTYAALGINGQMVLVHGPARTVVAKLSTWPEAWSASRSITSLTGCIDLAEQLAAGRT